MTTSVPESRLINAHEERRLACLVRSHRRATVAQTVEKLNRNVFKHSALKFGVWGCIAADQSECPG